MPSKVKLLTARQGRKMYEYLLTDLAQQESDWEGIMQLSFDSTWSEADFSEKFSMVTVDIVPYDTLATHLGAR